ncbi:hypothetical protein HN018_23375 (plasmid) [Lichenicola cladoniae]|uniref:Uncharacterized protein n=1 Tax=Lichenicola cladoniae TaxID=1484109 RepID=A0A6M8HY70_9PROT|nr:hypothetical protein [Lichenicola cladoniae]NPD66339.1 hypothetical protein [Acetobacteraceae bacterium]QKE93127.1 hypothetical protein HN018_23375 [Lichenicola cladoniae]
MSPLSALGASDTYKGMVIVSGAVGVMRSYRLDVGLPDLACSWVTFDPAVIEFPSLQTSSLGRRNP